MSKKIAILGAGSWGTALAHLIAHNGHTVHLWCKESIIADAINTTHKNPLFLPTALLPHHVIASIDMNEIITDAHLIIEAVPIQFLRTVLIPVPFSHLSCAQWIVTSKGFEKESGKNSMEILQDLYPLLTSITVLSGPSFASEVVQRVKTRSILSGKSKDAVAHISSFFENDYMKLSYLADTMGLLTCGAVKNIIALMLGIVEGAGYGKNTQAFMLTQAYKELKQLIEVVQGESTTVDTLGGLGDLFLTASSSTSKNKMYGLLKGQGYTQELLSQQFSTLPEGVESAIGLVRLLEQRRTSDRFFLLKHIPQLLSGTLPLETYIATLFYT